MRVTPNISKAVLVAEAEAQNSKYPQYKGHWSGPEWKLFLIKKNVKTKMGLAFEKGEVVLGKVDALPIESGPYIGQQSFTCYSSRNRIDTGLRACHVTIYDLRFL